MPKEQKYQSVTNAIIKTNEAHIKNTGKYPNAVVLSSNLLRQLRFELNIPLYSLLDHIWHLRIVEIQTETDFMAPGFISD